MLKPVTDDMRDPKTPDDVIIRAEARKPETDPTLGIPVTINKQGIPPNRLVALGDSLTHGYQSGAVFNTQISYPAIIAQAMGWKEFRYPAYSSPGEGLPLNVEWLARQIEGKFGDKISWIEFPGLLTFIRGKMDLVEDYWERGEGAVIPQLQEIYHNLAVYGWDLRNTISRNAGICQKILDDHPPKDDLLRQVVEYHNERAALRVLDSARDAQGNPLSPVEAAAELGTQGSEETGGDGIETLIIFIGANNALGSILTFKVNWTADGYDDMDYNDRYTVWRPIHFKAELDQLVEQVKKIRARHVIFTTVPHVTIVPFARGINKDAKGQKIEPGSRYFPYYSLPWMNEENFAPKKHPHLTVQEVRAIDSAIDQYNDAIADVVRAARTEGRDWYLFECAGLLDRLASRRYIEDPKARPSWWDEVGGQYPLPSALAALNPPPNSGYFNADLNGRKNGGLFSLDGIHPTTIGYGIVAQELINIMVKAGVEFDSQQVDFERLVTIDSLISNPPRSLASIFQIIGEIDKNFNLFSGILQSSY
jgi:hypothetical protein